ncbi:hypothetical protein HBI95_032980 [Parastagonospora nodorum]|nr:hypothetical protein HBI95_032980 [Parastagonospora nodorum]
MCSRRLKLYSGELATAESITAKDSNHVDTFSSDFAFSPLMARGNEDIAKTSSLSRLKADQHFFVYQNILLLIAFIISYCLFADELVYALNRVTVVLIIILRLTPSTLLAGFIPTTKIRDLFLKKNVAKSGILLICADGRIRQCYLTICAILADYEEQVLLTSVKKNRYYTRCTVTPNDREDLLTQESSTVVSLLFVSKAPFALHFIRAVYDLVTLAQYKSYDEDTLAYIQGALERINVFKEEFQVYRRTLEEEKNFNYSKALDSICTRANSELILGIQPYLIKLPLSEVAANIAISNFIYAAAVFQSSSKRYNDPKHCDEELYLILIIIDYTCYDKDRKHIAYIRAFSKNAASKRRTLQAFKFYNLSTIIRLVHLVPRDLPNLITRTTMSYYVNNYID